MGCLIDGKIRIESAHEIDHLTNVFGDIFLGSQEAHRQQNEFSWMMLLGAGNFLHLPLPGRRLCPLDFDRIDSGEVSIAVVEELLRCCAVLARIFSELDFYFFVAIVDSVNEQVQASASRKQVKLT